MNDNLQNKTEGVLFGEEGEKPAKIDLDLIIGNCEDYKSAEEALLYELGFTNPEGKTQQVDLAILRMLDNWYSTLFLSQERILRETHRCLDAGEVCHNTDLLCDLLRNATVWANDNMLPYFTNMLSHETPSGYDFLEATEKLFSLRVIYNKWDLENELPRQANNRKNIGFSVN